MKVAFLSAAAAALVQLSPAAVAADPAGHAAHAAQPAPAALSEGTVKSIDKAAGRVVLAHGPLANLGMPGMTMPFAVKDPAWLDKLKPGEKIRFRAEETAGGYAVVQIEPRR
jgi:Cu/Ag efflux protein CusF